MAVVMIYITIGIMIGIFRIKGATNLIIYFALISLLWPITLIRKVIKYFK